MDRGAWQVTVHGVARVRHDLATKPLKYLREEFGLIFFWIWNHGEDRPPHMQFGLHCPTTHLTVTVGWVLWTQKAGLWGAVTWIISVSPCLQTAGAARLWWRPRASWPGPERGAFPGPTRAGRQGGWEGFSGDPRGRSRTPHASQGECLASQARSWSDSTNWDSVRQAHILALCLVWTW